MIAKTLTHTAEDLAESGKDALMTVGHDLQHAASAVEDAATKATVWGSKALRRQAKRVRGAAMNARNENARNEMARTLRHHPYLSAATLLGSLTALAGITLLVRRSTSR